MAVTVKSQDEINRMRDAGKILAEVHEKTGRNHCAGYYDTGD